MTLKMMTKTLTTTAMLMTIIFMMIMMIRFSLTTYNQDSIDCIAASDYEEGNGVGVMESIWREIMI